jgi:transcriptional regulator with XRE-family HTH domain
MKDFDKRKQFVTLRAKGKSLSTIADEIGVSRQTLAVWQRYHDEEIANLRAMELDSLAEEYAMTEQGRIELIGEELRRVREELKKRDFSEVPTAKLVEMELRLSKELTKDFSKPNILTEKQVANDMRKRDAPYDPLDLDIFQPGPASEQRTPLFEAQKEGNGEKEQEDHRSKKNVRASGRASQSSTN